MIALVGSCHRPLPPEPLVTIAFACNDPNNGHFSGTFEHFEIHGPDGDAEVRLWGPGLALEQHKTSATVGRLVIVHNGWHHHVGNWCWDECRVSLQTAREVLASLLANKFKPEEWTTDGPFADLVGDAP